MNIIKGDLIDLARKGHFDTIVHGCNCFCTMGSGIAKQIRTLYPQAYEADCRTAVGDRNKLGTYTEAFADNFNIINAYTQFGYNKVGSHEDVFEYSAFKEILDTLANQYLGHSFGFPLIGCGLAGGDASKIIGMLLDFSQKVENNNGCSVTLVVKG